MSSRVIAMNGGIGGSVANLLRTMRYGQPVVVVSGLPRSGTSMLMNMLSAGGLPIVSDFHRQADPDNPQGYFEDDRVKDLDSPSDKSWLREARGKGIKVISHLLRRLPADNYYRVLLARRDLREIIISQNRMLERLGRRNPIADEEAMQQFAKHLQELHSLAGVRSNFELLEVSYSGVVQEPGFWVEKIRDFLQLDLDCRRMEAIIDQRLYRNRANQGAKS